MARARALRARRRLRHPVVVPGPLVCGTHKDCRRLPVPTRESVYHNIVADGIITLSTVVVAAPRVNKVHRVVPRPVCRA